MKFQLILLLSIAALFNIVHAQANTNKCNKDCMPNYVKCLTSTTYNVCMNGQSFGDIQECAEDTFCSDHKNVCMRAGEVGVNFVCGTENSYGGDGCGECLEDDIFTCVDKTHFTMCSNRDVYVVCNTGEVCVKEFYKISNKICVKESAIKELGLSESCSNDITTTAVPVSPTTPDSNTLILACENNPKDGDYYFTVNEEDLDTCRTYIYCQHDRDSNESNVGEWETAYLTCSPNKYYDDEVQGCVATKKPNCGRKKTSN